MNITHLRSAYTSFSAIACARLAKIRGIPKPGDEGVQVILAKQNKDVVGLAIEHGGYATLAISTLAKGRVDESLDSLVGLLGAYASTEECPVDVALAYAMPLTFVVATREDVPLENVTQMVSHRESFGACENNFQRLGLKRVEVDSNGVAAEYVANRPEFKDAAFLGPRIAAEMNNLTIRIDGFEDGPDSPVTTFLWFEPRTTIRPRLDPKEHKAIVVFRLQNVPGAFSTAIAPFGKYGLDLTYIRSFRLPSPGDQERHDFAIEVRVAAKQAEAYAEALREAEQRMSRYIAFGPFPVVTE